MLLPCSKEVSTGNTTLDHFCPELYLLCSQKVAANNICPDEYLKHSEYDQVIEFFIKLILIQIAKCSSQLLYWTAQIYTADSVTCMQM